MPRSWDSWTKNSGAAPWASQSFFLHIPRTAGTTLNAVIRNNFAPEEVLSIYSRADYERMAVLDEEVLAPIRLIQGHLFLQSYDPPMSYAREVEVFTFLREPVARLVSQYLFELHWEENSLHTFLNEGGVTFADYVTSDCKELRYRGRNFMTRMLSGMDFALDSFPRAALDAAKRNLESVFGFVGVQERFDESLVMLQDFLGLESILHERRNALRPALKERIAEADLALAAERNAADIELHAFAAELFEHRVSALGDAFQARVARFREVNARFAKVCALMARRNGQDMDADIVLPKDDTII